jgi:hypothetical protein
VWSVEVVIEYAVQEAGRVFDIDTKLRARARSEVGYGIAIRGEARLYEGMKGGSKQLESV